MGTIEVFDHTADVGLRVRGGSLDDLFRTAAEGLFDFIVANRDAVRLDRVDRVSLRAESTADLLFAWVDELIYRSEVGHLLYGRFDVRLAHDGLSLEAEVAGEAMDRDRHELDHEVKAVTRHDFGLVRDGDTWVAELILDI